MDMLIIVPPPGRFSAEIKPPCAWTTAYDFAFVSGEAMATTTAIADEYLEAVRKAGGDAQPNYSSMEGYLAAKVLAGRIP